MLDITTPDTHQKIVHTYFNQYFKDVALDPDCDLRWGKNIKISPFVSIGNVGFGFERDGDYYKIPLQRREHQFGVVIYDDVEIGSQTVIHRGRWRDTVIGEGTKIDSLCHIAHNVIIGKNCLIVAGSVLGGSCEIGDECFLGINIGVGQGSEDDNDGGKVSIKQGVKIGNKVTIGMGAVVLHDIPDYVTVVGNPAHVLLDGKDYCVICGLYNIKPLHSVCPRCKGKLK